MSETEPFDPDDPFNAMAESFRLQVCSMILDAEKAAIYRDMTPIRRLECFLAGALTGVIGVALASIEDKGRDAMMQYIVEATPVARAQAEGILDDRT